MSHPDKIGRYKIKEVLGEGEIGAVYRAFDPSFNREVAIKVLPLELMRNLKILARFRPKSRERRGSRPRPESP